MLVFLKMPESQRTWANVAQLFRQQLTPYQAERLSTFAERMLQPGPLAQALAGVTNWCTAEILRRHGEGLLMGDGADRLPEAEALFLRAIEISRKQKALMWELRSSLGLAKLWRETAQISQARDILSRACDCFPEGSAMPELVEAKAQLVPRHRDCDGLGQRKTGRSSGSISSSMLRATPG